jgi:hypothetical protein
VYWVYPVSTEHVRDSLLCMYGYVAMCREEKGRRLKRSERGKEEEE